MLQTGVINRKGPADGHLCFQLQPCSSRTMKKNLTAYTAQKSKLFFSVFSLPLSFSDKLQTLPTDTSNTAFSPMQYHSPQMQSFNVHTILHLRAEIPAPQAHFTGLMDFSCLPSAVSTSVFSFSAGNCFLLYQEKTVCICLIK